MKRKSLPVFRRLAFPLLMLFFIAGPVEAGEDPSPVVSVQWLAEHVDMNNLAVIDIRTHGEYSAGHIPGSVNIPFEMPVSAWIVVRDDILLEVPEKKDLFKTLGDNGITKQSVAVVVTSGPAEQPYPLADAARVAVTLIYTGLKKVSILDGGHAAWVAEDLPVTTKIPAIKPATYRGRINKKMFVSKEYVKNITEQKNKKPVLIDARDADVFEGSVVEPHADKAGHIHTAKSLPAVLIWNNVGLYKSAFELESLAEPVAGSDKKREIVVYCGLGGYASAWWFVLTQILDYENLTIYDGAAQEWSRYYDMVSN